LEGFLALGCFGVPLEWHNRNAWGTAMKALGIGLALIAMINVARAEDCRDPLVKTSDAAERIAFVMWGIVNPHFTRTDEKAWASGFATTLQDCTWHVAARPGPRETYSTFVISIGAKDGRFLGAEISD
jgi:hypothetical protein